MVLRVLDDKGDLYLYSEWLVYERRTTHLYPRIKRFSSCLIKVFLGLEYNLVRLSSGEGGIFLES